MELCINCIYYIYINIYTVYIHNYESTHIVKKNIESIWRDPKGTLHFCGKVVWGYANSNCFTGQHSHFFTGDIPIPIFHRLGFKVQFSGNPYQLGKENGCLDFPKKIQWTFHGLHGPYIIRPQFRREMDMTGTAQLWDLSFFFPGSAWPRRKETSSGKQNKRNHFLVGKCK